FDCDWSSDVCSSDLLPASDYRLGSVKSAALVQNAGIMADQRVGYGRCFTPQPLLQPGAKSMPKITRTLLEKSFRQIEAAVLQFQDRKSTRLNSSHSQ